MTTVTPIIKGKDNIHNFFKTAKFINNQVSAQDEQRPAR